MKILNGLVLSGGKSTRMGSDKGLLIRNNKPWVMEMAERLEPYCEETYISIRKNQEPLYQPYVMVFNFIPDQNDLKIAGPARGLITAHLFDLNRDWFVISTDMLNVTDEVFLPLKKAWKENNSYDAYLFKTVDGIEPLCGIFSAEGLKKLMEKMIFTQNYSIVAHLNTMNIFECHNEKLPVDAFKSFNSVEDIKDLKST